MPYLIATFVLFSTSAFAFPNECHLCLPCCHIQQPPPVKPVKHPG